MACGCKNKKQNDVQQGDITIEPIVAQNTANTVERQQLKGVNAASVYRRDDITIEPVTATNIIPESVIDRTTARAMVGARIPLSAKRVETLSVEEDATRLGLKQCYLCAKKHLAEAQILFGEYHTGYPAYIKNLIESTRVAEVEVRKAFLVWQKIMSQMNMSENELLGNDANKLSMRAEHIKLANKIRDERLKLSDDVMYSPDFDSMLVEIHALQHKVLENG